MPGRHDRINMEKRAWACLAVLQSEVIAQWVIAWQIVFDTLMHREKISPQFCEGPGGFGIFN